MESLKAAWIFSRPELMENILAKEIGGELFCIPKTLAMRYIWNEDSPPGFGIAAGDLLFYPSLVSFVTYAAISGREAIGLKHQRKAIRIAEVRAGAYAQATLVEKIQQSVYPIVIPRFYVRNIRFGRSALMICTDYGDLDFILWEEGHSLMSEILGRGRRRYKASKALIEAYLFEE